MKQIKFLMMALTLLMGVTFTSCLDSGDSESTFDWAGYVYVRSYMGGVYFKDQAGNTLYPTSASLAQVEANGFKVSDSKFALIYVKHVDKEGTTPKDATNPSTPQKFDVALVGFQEIEYNQTVIANDKNEMDQRAPETAPVITLSVNDGFSVVNPMYYDDQVLLMPISWGLTNDKDKFKQHKLYLACRIDEIKPADTDLTFYVRHDRGEDKEQQTYYAAMYAYEVNQAVEQFTRITGNRPRNLVIKAHEAGFGTSQVPEIYREYKVEYKKPSVN